MHKTPSIRTLAIQALDQWETGHVYAESLVQKASQHYQLKQSDRNLLNALLLDTLRNLKLIDFWIGELRQGKLDDHTRNLLRIGLCQLHLLNIPQHAAVNETVNAAKKSTRGLVNAILRKSLRESDSLEKAQAKQALNVRYSHPEWLTTHWISIFGEKNTESLLQWNQQPAETTFRLNPLKNEVHHLLQEAENLRSVENHPDFFYSKGLPPLAWIEDGLIYIQDPATSHAVELLKAEPGETVLDACAAPGGKSTQIAACMQNAGSLFCTDSNAKRLPRLEANLSRLGVSISQVQECDWLQPAPVHFLEKFDAILLDVPCSNTGVLRRRIDARWRLQQDDFSQLNQLQERILENALPCLKKGGRIVYSTCSIEPQENQELIQRFCEKNPQIECLEEKQITPFKHQTDGAYAALLRHKQ